ncbi:hypothetical protein ACTG13_08660 [Aeromonas hydrophila]|uniref:hypothetical protein n=1 Tax=Aeromonas hydrophila TaxID=644 RepID=UPI003F7A7CB1
MVDFVKRLTAVTDEFEGLADIIEFLASEFMTSHFLVGVYKVTPDNMGCTISYPVGSSMTIPFCRQLPDDFHLPPQIFKLPCHHIYINRFDMIK